MQINGINSDLIEMNNEITKQMANLYLLFCQPVYTVGKTVNLKYRWVNLEARSMYKEYEKLLVYNKSLEPIQKQDGSAHAL
jgi:hypothetical protein